MIVEAIFQAFLDLVGQLISAAIVVIGVPPNVDIQIPRPFYDLFNNTLNSALQTVGVLIAFYVWRQVKA
jgi:hypothetical protein